MTSTPGTLARIFNRPHRQPHYEIVTSLPVGECKDRLAGRPVRGKGRVKFARPLKLDGWISDRRINVDLADGESIIGDVVEDGGQTRLLLWMSRPIPLHVNLMFGLLPAGVAVATLLGYLPGSVSSVLFVSAIWGIVWLRRKRCRASYASMTVDETVQMIANLAQASDVRQPAAGVEKA